MVFKVRGIIEFSPINKTKKHNDQSSWKKVAMIRTKCDLDLYYSWFLRKRFNLELNRSIRGTHITFISDRINDSVFEQASKLFNGKEIDFYVELDPLSSGKHWWLRVYCPEAENIREVMGLTKDPYYGLHLTLGYAVVKYPEIYENDNTNAIKASKDYLEHSKYILQCCMKYELISNKVRRPLSEHEIIEF